MTNSEKDRQIKKLSYWRFVRPAPTKIYKSGVYEKRGVYLCTLCNYEYELAVGSEKSNHSTCCLKCSRVRVNRRRWQIYNLDTKTRLEVVNLKHWCLTHGVDPTSMYRTKKETPLARRINFAKDKQGQRWKVLEKLN